jgi:beta-glucosidase
MVLPKNDGGTLPLDPSNSVAVIGPLGNDQHDMLGPWAGTDRDADAVSLFDGIKGRTRTRPSPKAARSSTRTRRTNTPADECGSDAGFPPAVAAANAADQVVLALGESRGQSGE